MFREDDLLQLNLLLERSASVSLKSTYPLQVDFFRWMLFTDVFQPAAVSIGHMYKIICHESDPNKSCFMIPQAKLTDQIIILYGRERNHAPLIGRHRRICYGEEVVFDM